MTRAPPAADVMRETREAKKKRTRAEEETGEGAASSAVSSAPIGNVDPIEAPECDIESGRSRGERLKPETRREKAARADRDDALKRVIAAAAAAAAAGRRLDADARPGGQGEHARRGGQGHERIEKGGEERELNIRNAHRTVSFGVSHDESAADVCAHPRE